MPISVFKDCYFYLDGYDLSGDHNEHRLKYSCNLIESTPFNADTKRRTPGLKDLSSSHNGFSEAGAGKVDEILFNRIGAAEKAASIYPTAMSLGDIGFGYKVLIAKLGHGAKIGELWKFSVDADGTGTLVRLTLMDKGAKTVSGNGAARNLGAVSSSQGVYAVAHVIAVAGTAPTLNLTIESDDVEAFTTPITRLTFTQFTAIGAQLINAVGPITDAWWRAKWVIGGTGPSFTIVVGVGIQ
jgi:hypothetical protein